MPYTQTLNVVVTTETDRPRELVEELLDGHRHVVTARVDPVTAATEVPVPNKQRLIDLATWAAGEHAKKELGLPSEWDQGHWLKRDRDLSCGTTCCIAGKVALDDGGVPDGGWHSWEDTHDGDVSGVLRFPDGQLDSASGHARRALGLTFHQADRLFDGDNGLTDVLAVIGALLNGRDVDEV